MNYHDTAPTADAEVSVVLGEDFTELRNAVRQICKGFPGEYWRKLDDRSGYPTEFVAALTEAGFLGSADPGGIWRLRPAAARRGRDPGRDQRRWLQRQPGACADVHHGHGAAAWQRGAEAQLSAGDRAREGCGSRPSA